MILNSIKMLNVGFIWMNKYTKYSIPKGTMFCLKCISSLGLGDKYASFSNSVASFPKNDIWIYIENSIKRNDPVFVSASTLKFIEWNSDISDFYTLFDETR